jgi:hypothetical protein
MVLPHACLEAVFPREPARAGCAAPRLELHASQRLRCADASLRPKGSQTFPGDREWTRRFFRKTMTGSFGLLNNNDILFIFAARRQQ